MNNHGYEYIEMWGRELGSTSYFIQAQCDKARQDKAPLNAIYEDHDHPGTWSTTDDIANNPLRVRLGLEPLPPTAPVILRAYHGELTGETDGNPEIRFATLPDAARWVSDKNLASRARYIGYSVQGFDQPVTVRLLAPAEER